MEEAEKDVIAMARTWSCDPYDKRIIDALLRIIDARAERRDGKISIPVSDHNATD